MIDYTVSSDLYIDSLILITVLRFPASEEVRHFVDTVVLNWLCRVGRQGSLSFHM